MKNSIDNDFDDFDATLEKAAVEAARREKINSAIDDKKEELGIQSDEELKEVLPRQDSKKHGTLEIVRLDDISLTKENKLTRTEYFKKMDARSQIYGEITFSPQEALSVSMYYKRLSTGTNSVAAMKCMGQHCPFAADCAYQQIQKAPIGKPCLVEYDLLNYHSQKFIEQFQVDPENHAEMLLVQELSEYMMYEMRVTRLLAKEGENSLLHFTEISFDQMGNEMETTKIHWAWELKEKIKNRRMKLLEALNAMRVQNKKIADNNSIEDYGGFATETLKKISLILKKQSAIEAEYVEEEDDAA